MLRASWTSFLLVLFLTPFAVAQPRPNILFLISDDLNNTLGCYNAPLIRTPNIDRLASRGMVFERAYCSFPLCGPSRNSLLTGLYPNSTGILTNSRIFRQTIPEQMSMPQAFRMAGYFVGRIGKLYHFNVPNSVGTDGHDDPASWELELNPVGVERLEEHPKITTLVPNQFGGTLSWHASAKSDKHHTDAMQARDAEWVLERCAKDKDRPFFLSVGFFRPHTPYVSPKDPYFGYYPLEKMPVATNIKEDQADMPKAALGSAHKVQDEMTEGQVRECLQAYYASVSFMDTQVGKILDALDRLGLAENTIIVFTSDHGYHLGEHGLWQKRSLFEQSARVPLIVSLPGTTKPGSRAANCVSHVDLFPTLADLCSVAKPSNLQGQSLVPMLKDSAFVGRGWAVTQVDRNGNGGQVANNIDKERQGFFGYSLRTNRYRYTEWNEGKAGKELYDHETDPKELKNLALDASYEKQMSELSTLLASAVKSTFPTSGKTPTMKEGMWAPMLVDP
jgi:choline-sulfatase